MEKKETFEEAADRYFPFAEKIGGETYTAYRGFIEGAKWQEQNSDKKYSEEEVIYLLDRFWDRLDVWYNETEDNELNLRKWFEQYKKK